jgi:hypothetical protein
MFTNSARRFQTHQLQLLGSYPLTVPEKPGAPESEESKTAALAKAAQNRGAGEDDDGGETETIGAATTATTEEVKGEGQSRSKLAL